jgi:hypothetical protein
MTQGHEERVGARKMGVGKGTDETVERDEFGVGFAAACAFYLYDMHTHTKNVWGPVVVLPVNKVRYGMGRGLEAHLEEPLEIVAYRLERCNVLERSSDRQF